MSVAAQKLAEPIFNDQVRADIDRVFTAQQAYALELRKSTAEERIAKIKKLLEAVENRREDIYAACYADFKKPESEVDIGEIMAIVSEAKHAIKSLKQWMKPVQAAAMLKERISGLIFSYEMGR